MPVSNEITHLEHSAVKLSLTVGKDDVRSTYNEIIKEYIKSAVIPGFRKGKVPQDVLERKYGPFLRGEAVNKICNNALTQFFEDESFPKENRPLPYSTPRLDEESIPKEDAKLDLDNDFTFSVTYDILPKVQVGAWKGLEIEIPNVSIDNDDIKRELDEIRERNAMVIDRDDNAKAAKNDIATIDYCELDEAKNPLKETERQDFVFTIGSGHNIYQIDDEIIGMKKGESKDISKTFDADYRYQEMAGKTCTIRVTLTALKEKKLPDLDDDLAQDVDEKFNTLDDLKNNIKDKLNKNLETTIRNLTVSRILEKVLEATPIDLPLSMINLELDAQFRNMAKRYGLSVEEFAKQMVKMGQNPEQLLAEWRPQTEKALKSRLIVETLMRDLNLETNDEETDKEIERIAGETGHGENKETIKKYYENPTAREYLQDDIKERKLFDLMIAENKIIKGKKESYLELVSGNQKIKAME